MISSIQLKNFQCHTNSIFEFNQHLNIICGGNNVGKSSVLRALYWVFTNKPKGDWMRRTDDNKLLPSEVVVKLTNGSTIVRYKGKNNYYEINGQMFTELGQDIPVPLSSIIGELKLKLGSNVFYPNFNLPDERSFIVYESSSVKGSLINYFTGINIVEELKKQVKSDIRETKNIIKGKNQSIEVLKKELDGYDGLNLLDSEYSKIVDGYNDYNKSSILLVTLNGFWGFIIDYKNNMRSYKKQKEIIDLYRNEYLKKFKILTMLSKYCDFIIKHVSLHNTYEQYCAIIKLNEQYRDFINQYKELNILFDTMDDKLNTLGCMDNDIKEIKKLYDDYNSVKTKYKVLHINTEHYWDTVNQYNNANQKYKNLLIEKGSLPELCPTCKKPI